LVHPNEKLVYIFMQAIDMIKQLNNDFKLINYNICPLNLIITALIERGGIWGIIASALFFWNVHKETSLAKKENKTQDNVKIVQDAADRKEREAKDYFDRKEKELREKIEDLEQYLMHDR
jgi:hypothetical protein